MVAPLRPCSLVLVLSAFLVTFLAGQVVPAGKRIGEIRVRIDGPRTVGEEFVRKNLAVEPGTIYRVAAVDKSIRNLMETQYFEDVRVYLDSDFPEADGIALVFRVRTAPRIGEILFEGNNKISKRRLERRILSRVGDVLEVSALETDERALRDYYREKGFWEVIVKTKIDRPDDETRSATVAFLVTEGEKRVIRKIAFEGNEALSSRFLRSQMKTRARSLFRFWAYWSKENRYDRDLLEEDIESLRNTYRNMGFLDVSLREADGNATDGNEQAKPQLVGGSGLLILIKVNEGKRSYVGEVKVTGNVSFSSEELLDQIELGSGSVYSPADLDNDVARIRKAYGKKGFLDVRVIPIRRANLDTGKMDITLTVTENNKFTVNTVNIRGNDKTRSIVILRELALAPGDLFDTRRMEISAARLRNTRFFERVNVDDEPLPGQDEELRRTRRNFVVNVKEGRTGHFSLGVGFSSLEKAMMFAEFRQGNFDLSRWRAPQFLQGDGQKFRLRLQLGTRSNQAILAFEEPWFMEKRLAAGFELFHTKSDYYSSYYDEFRSGFELYLRRQLFELVEGRLFYRYDDVMIDDVLDPAPIDIDEEDLLISKLGIELSRDTTDRILFPTEGSRISLRKEFAGGPFGGDANYGRFEIKGGRYLKVSESMEQVLSLMARAGTIARYEGDEHIPFFERFYLGGPHSLRGWDYRDVGPLADKGEPTGGESYTYVSAEYTVRLADPLRLAFFYDGGFLNRGDFEFDPNAGEGWFDNWGLGLRFMVMGAPLRLDLGFPISDPTDMGGEPQFHFSFGTRF